MPERLVMNESQSADLICSVTGDPPVQVYWNTTSLTSNHTIGNIDLLGMIPLTDDNGTLDSLGSLYYDNNSTTLVLSISEASGADNGVVSCVAENEVGQEVAEASLEINGEESTKTNGVCPRPHSHKTSFRVAVLYRRGFS